WNTVLNNLPQGKAAGLSGIPYEILKHLPLLGQTYLREIINLCFETSSIPTAWKEATIYPIPKPHEWNCFLQNTRSITLLDTARKMMTRLLYNHIAFKLVDNNVLTVNNFAGFPGNSCDPPLVIFEAFSVLTNAKTRNKPLFVFQQDISKA